MRNKLEAIRWLLKNHGFLSIFIYTARKWVWSRNNNSCRLFLFILDKPKPNAKSIQNSEGHIFRFATLEDLEIMHNENDYEISRDDITAFKNGDRCLLQLDGKKLTGYSWIASSQLVEIIWGFHFNMPDDTVYNYKGYTSPEYRGKGFQSLRHLKLLEHVQSTGQYQLFGFVDHLNLSSLKGVNKSGYRKIGVLRGNIKNNTVNFKLKTSEKHWGSKKRT